MKNGGKNSFILYDDSGTLVDMLSDEMAGRLFKAIFQYRRGELNVAALPREVALVFRSIQIYLDRDKAKWEEILERRKQGGALGAQYGKLGGRPRKGSAEESASEEKPLKGLKKPLNTLDGKNDEGDEAEPNTPYVKIQSLWNEICVSYSRVQGINGERKKLTKARWKEHPDLDWWQEFFMKIEANDFLAGRVKNWRASYDWVINPNNCDKIIEGKFEPRVIETPLTDRATTDYDF